MNLLDFVEQFCSNYPEEDKRRVYSVVSWFENLPSLVDAELNKLEVYPKGHSDVVTSLDLAVERSFFLEIGDKFPDDAVISEESGWKKGHSDFLHVLDPIDLTRNVARGLPFLCLYALRKNNNPLMASVMGFRDNFLYMGFQRGCILYSDFSVIQKFLVKDSTGSHFRFARTHNFRVEEDNVSYISRSRGSTRSDYYLELLNSRVDCYLATLDDNGIQWGFYAWDFLPFLDLLQLSEKIQVMYMPSEDVYVHEDGRLVSGGDYLKTILCFNKSREEEALQFAKRLLGI